MIMKDDVDEIIKGRRRTKIQYYISPLLVKITIIILLLLVLALDTIFE